MFAVEVTPDRGVVAHFKRYAIQTMERAAMIATDRAIRASHRELVASLREVGLGRVVTGAKGGVVGVTSDLAKGKVRRTGEEGFSASGVQFQKYRGERIDGLLKAYGEGASILPRRGGYLWFPTDDIKRLGVVAAPSTGGASGSRKRITPGNWAAAGLDTKIGPLVFIRGRRRGEKLAIVRNVGLNAAGRPGSARSLKRNGQPRRGDVQKDFIVAFVGIRSTFRAQRFDARQIALAEATRLGGYYAEALRKEGR